MGDERYSQGSGPRRDNDRYGRDGRGGSFGRGGMGDFRDYDAAGESGDYRYRGQGERDFYGQRDYGNQRYDQRDRQYGGRTGERTFGRVNYDGQGAGYRGTYQAREEQRDIDQGYTQPPEYHGSYASDGRRFEDVGRYRNLDNDTYHDPDERYRARGQGQGGYGRQPQGYDYQERGFLQRAGDELRSWFGDDDAERRRDLDARYDERTGGGRHRDGDYHSWRAGQIDALDRDYDEYRRENSSRFDNEFATWRTARQGQRDALTRVQEHMDVLGSDGEHVGTVDKVRGDQILLTKNDADAGGRHHTIPSRWIETVDTRGVTLSKTAADAKQQWQDAENSRAMFGDKPDGGQDATGTARTDGERSNTQSY